MSERLFIEGSTRAGRHEMITRIERAISDNGGWVLDHHFFSNVALSLNFEIGAGKIEAMLDALRASGLNLSRRNAEEIQQRIAALAEPVPADTQIAGFLHVTFVHDDPDLRQEIPAIPG